MAAGESKRTNLSVTIQKTVKKMKEKWYEYKLNMILDDFEATVADDNVGSIERKVLLSDKCRVAVVGEFNRGKSSVINALLGENLLPTYLNPCTAVKTEVQFSQVAEAFLTFSDGKYCSVPFSELQDWLTKKNKNSNLIDWASVRYPSDFLMDTGVTLIDTPGLNDNGLLDDRTFEAMHQTDMLLWVLSPNSPLSISEENYLKELVIGANIRNIVFVINKIDMVDEEDRLLLLDNVRTRIHDAMAEVLSEAELDTGKYGNVVLFSARDALKARKSENPELLRNSGFFTLLSMMEAEIDSAMYRKIHEKLPNAVKDKICNAIAGLDEQAAYHTKEAERHQAFADRFHSMSSFISEYPIETAAKTIAIEQRKLILSQSRAICCEFRRSVTFRGMDIFLSCIKDANRLCDNILHSTSISSGIDELKSRASICMADFSAKFAQLSEEACIPQHQELLFTENQVPESSFLPQFSFDVIDFPLLMFKRNLSAREDYMYPIVEKKTSRVAYTWEEAVVKWIKAVFAIMARHGQERIDSSVQILEQRSFSEKQLAEEIMHGKQYTDLQRILADIETLHTEDMDSEPRSLSNDNTLMRNCQKNLLTVLTNVKLKRTEEVNVV